MKEDDGYSKLLLKHFQEYLKAHMSFRQRK